MDKVNEICTINVLYFYEYRKGNGHHPARKDVQDRVRARANANARLISPRPISTRFSGFSEMTIPTVSYVRAVCRSEIL